MIVDPVQFRDAPVWAEAAVDWSSVSQPAGVLDAVTDWAAPPDGVRAPVLFLGGPAGSGKTFLACAVGYRAARAGVSGVFARHAGLGRLSTFDTTDRERFDVLCRVPLLVLDDLCSDGPMSAFVLAQTAEVFAARDDRGLLTVVTSNLAEAMFTDVLGPRLSSRASLWRKVWVVGADRRAGEVR